MISNESTYMNHPELKKIYLELRGNVVKLGKRGDWEKTQILLSQMLRNLVNLSNKSKVADKRRNEDNQGLLVQGIRNALAT